MSKPVSKPAKPYVSDGRVLSSPPFLVRVRGFFDHATLFLGLYVTTFFALDPWLAGSTSAYNINNRERDGTRTGKGFFGGSGGSGGSGGGGSGGSGGGKRGPGSGGRKLGTVDDVRGPECGSCG